MRLFTAIKLPSNIKDIISSASQELKMSSHKGNFIAPYNYHMTLVYLGAVDSSYIAIVKQIINECASIFAPFSLVCEDIGHFDKKRNRILYYNVGGAIDLLEKLQLDLYVRFYKNNLCREQSDFVPHMTFAKKVEVSNIPIIKQHVRFQVKDITLFSSSQIDKRLTYTPIYSSPLVGSNLATNCKVNSNL